MKYDVLVFLFCIFSECVCNIHDSKFISIDFLKEALMTCSSEKARESLEAQINFHESRLKLIEQRKDYFKKKVDDYQKRKTDAAPVKKHPASAAAAKGSSFEDVQGVEEDGSGEVNQIYLESEIYRVIEEHDSLLNFLIERNESSSETEKNKTIGSHVRTQEEIASHGSSALNLSYTNGSKVPKNDRTVIEELKTNNDQLRQLVHQLVGELEKLQVENHQLRIDLIGSQAEKMMSNVSALPELPPLEPPKLLY